MAEQPPKAPPVDVLDIRGHWRTQLTVCEDHGPQFDLSRRCPMCDGPLRSMWFVPEPSPTRGAVDPSEVERLREFAEWCSRIEGWRFTQVADYAKRTLEGGPSADHPRGAVSPAPQTNADDVGAWEDDLVRERDRWMNRALDLEAESEDRPSTTRGGVGPSWEVEPLRQEHDAARAAYSDQLTRADELAAEVESLRQQLRGAVSPEGVERYIQDALFELSRSRPDSARSYLRSALDELTATKRGAVDP